jgi:quinol-cytochrome oxidoreductase complex cytochrome b subunit
VLMCLVLLVTGALELFYYVPTSAGANISLQTITILVPYGRLVRSLHFWSAQILVVTSLLHLLRVVLSGAYKRPRSFNWLIGLSLLVLMLLFDFTGYVLRWDIDIAWALLVGTNLLKSIPLLGTDLYALVVGGGAISDPTLGRFYGWHIYALPLVTTILLAWHIFRVRRDGGISRSQKSSQERSIITRDELLNRELIAGFVALIFLLGIAEASAPWFFLWIQQLLRLGSPFTMGVLLPLFLLVLLALIPYLLDREQEGVGVWFNRRGRAAQIVALILVGFVLVLTLVGALQ